MIKIALIGAGQIGSRHLQALCQLDRPAELIVVDPSEQALDIAKQRATEIHAYGDLAVSYHNEMPSLLTSLDIAIIATGAKYRRHLIEHLTKRRHINSLILEKFLFQSTSDFHDISHLLKELRIASWVNCARRAQPSYLKLKADLSEEIIQEVNVSGPNWGLACNSIHFIDLIAYLTGSLDYKIDNVFFDGVIPSKREGYIEFTGSFRGHFKLSDGQTTLFQISSYKDSETPLLIRIVTNRGIYLIDEAHGKLFKKALSFDVEMRSFPIIFQSQLTHLIVKGILESGKSELPTYEDSMKLHLPLLKIFLDSYSHYTQRTESVCPIT